MRRISFFALVRSVEFRGELNLETAAGLFELSFCARHVSQQYVQLLRTQYQQSEHKDKQDFGTYPHDSPLSCVLSAGDGDRGAGRFFFVSFHGRLEAADALSNSFAKFWSFLGPNTSKAIPKMISRCMG